MKIDIAGVKVDNITKQETILKIDEFVRSGRPHYIVTPYSEFVVFAQKDSAYKDALNKADLSLPDGVGVLWAAAYLNQRGDSIFKVLLSLFRLLFNPAYGRTVIKERVVGSYLIWDITKLASENNYSLALVGGFSDVATKTALKLKQKYPELKISLILADRYFTNGMLEEINRSGSDILLVAYSPPKQELWLSQNIQKLKVKVAIGLGGTFDYISGQRLSAPGFLHYLGLEWLWRLLTQPWRWKRMWNAIIVFPWIVYKYKATVHSRESGNLK